MTLRLRKASLRSSSFSASISFLTETGRVQDVTGIAGSNLTGKTTLLRFIRNAYTSAAVEGAIFPRYFDDMDGEVDWEINGVISTSVLRKGQFTQNSLIPKLVLSHRNHVPEKLEDIFLSYDTQTRIGLLLVNELHSIPPAVTLLSQIFADFHNHKVKNSVVFIDDFNLGLDKSNQVVFLSKIIRTVLKRDNQLIVTCHESESLGGMDVANIRQLSGSYDVVGEAISKMEETVVRDGW